MLKLPLAQGRGTSLERRGAGDQPRLAGGQVPLWFQLLISRSLHGSPDSSWKRAATVQRVFVNICICNKRVFFHLRVPPHSYPQLFNLQSELSWQSPQGAALTPSANSTGESIRFALYSSPRCADAPPLALPLCDSATEVIILSTTAGWQIQRGIFSHGLWILLSSLASPRERKDESALDYTLNLPVLPSFSWRFGWEMEGEYVEDYSEDCLF